MKGPGSNYSRGLCDMFKARHFALKKKKKALDFDTVVEIIKSAGGVMLRNLK